MRSTQVCLSLEEIAVDVEDAQATRQRALDKGDWSNEGSVSHDGYSSVTNRDLANAPPPPEGQHEKPRWTGLPHESFVSTACPARRVIHL